jgi:GAF domain-containing protein
MLAPAIPDDEKRRMDSLRSLNLLFTPAEERFDRITRLASRLLEVPIAVVSLVADNQQWFKSTYGLNATETSREVSFCGHAILGNETFVVENAMLDPRFYDNPLVTNDPHIRFYAGLACPKFYVHPVKRVKLVFHTPLDSSILMSSAVV